MVDLKKERAALIGYILLVFVLMAPAVLLEVEAAVIYVQLALVVMGVAAIALQKLVHREPIADMGFRLNRNAVVGMAAALVATVLSLMLAYWLPERLGIIELTVNRASPLVADDVPLTATLLSLAISGGLMFLMALFTEELAHRGYILAKLERLIGRPKAIVFGAALFGLWHIPAYYALYAGGAEQQGFLSVLSAAMIGSGLSVVPLCILYLTTRELYGVSLSHALFDLVAYHVVASPALGVMAQQAIFDVEILNRPLYQAIEWILPLAAIPIMLAIAALAKRFVTAPGPPPAS
jgi:membrane protease YdiL (CAAX protease family)